MLSPRILKSGRPKSERPGASSCYLLLAARPVTPGAETQCFKSLLFLPIAKSLSAERTVSQSLSVTCAFQLGERHADSAVPQAALQEPRCGNAFRSTPRWRLCT